MELSPNQTARETLARVIFDADGYRDDLGLVAWTDAPPEVQARFLNYADAALHEVGQMVLRGEWGQK